MGWLDKRDETAERKKKLFRDMIAREIESMTEEQLVVAVVIAQKVRAGDPRWMALIDEAIP